jgi:predicted nuclease of restriction endonuclease-like (RecB) superfamily
LLARGRRRTVRDLLAPSSLRPEGYAEWLTDLKARVHAAQQRAALAVNMELLELYWSLGRDLSERRQEWGTGAIDQVSADLRAAFPEMKGFSPSNLKYMRAFAEAWPDGAIRQQPVGELPACAIAAALVSLMPRWASEPTTSNKEPSR